MHIRKGPATLATHLLGPHPIIAHFLERLNLRSIISSHVGTGRDRVIDHGEALSAQIHNILDSPAPLYRIAQWAQPLAPQSFGFTPDQKMSLNDDRIARMLDALVSERARGIWFDLALGIIKQFKVATQRLHQDTTTVTFCGNYNGSIREPRITYGHNKDFRPDLKQLVFGLTVSSDGSVPIHHQVLSGNRTDDRIHRGNLEELRQILGRSDFIYVADGKLATRANLLEIERHQGKFVTVLPRTRSEDKRFRKKLSQKGARWRKVLEIANKRQENGEPDVFYACPGWGRTAEGFRLVWLRSSAKAQQDEAFREKALGDARAELMELKARLNRRQLRSQRQIRQAIAKIFERGEVKPFLRVQLRRSIQKEFKRLKPGRPGPRDPVRVVRRTIWDIQVEPDKIAIQAAKRGDGVFPIASNMKKASKKDILLIYKYQPYVEKRFSQIKTDLEVAPVYLKKPLRCAGLVHAYFVALAVSSLIERAVRRGMERHKIKSLPLYPEGRPTETPTCIRILEAFNGVCWHEFRQGKETIRFPIKLNALQRLLLKLLEVPAELYR
ncbi:MAG: IS1634 family transposase [Elusimicrobia bacterium]|nr:IS1634 family transposase [Elusimicrobiota bacterium]